MVADKFGTITADRVTVSSISVLHNALKQWRSQERFECLTGWRDELCPIFMEGGPSGIERSGHGLFGIQTFGVHINVFTRTPEGYQMWVAVRSKTKPTFPGCYDQCVAGGIPMGETKYNAMLRECEEEASIPMTVAQSAIPTGAVSYTAMNSLGFCPEIQYCYDLETGITPMVHDNEVERFELLPIPAILDIIASGQFKPNSAAVVIDFCIRHGLFTPDDPLYDDLFHLIHQDHHQRPERLDGSE